MQLLSEIVFRGRETGASPLSGPGKEDKTDCAAIQLLQGDLTAIPKQHHTDILVVSAFPGDYTPLPGSLMYALHEKGIEVGEFAKDKAVDLVKQLGCWLSKPLSSSQQEQFNFKQILCFEPSRESGSPDTVVSNIFRCINNFVFSDNNNVIAMPVLASGRQKVPVEKMLPAMLDACIFWMESGIPLHYIKLIVHNEEHAAAALPIFERARQDYEANIPPYNPLHAGVAGSSPSSSQSPPPPSRSPIPPPQAPPQFSVPSSSPPSPPPPAPDPDEKSVDLSYDFFISYSHVQTEQVAELVKALKEKNSSLNIFYDHSSIPTGGLWIRQISDAIQRSTSVVCVLSPQYRDSDACWDEFQCAKVKEYRTKKPVIKTINFLADADMPLIMSLYSYIDCTEGDINKLRNAVGSLL